MKFLHSLRKFFISDRVVLFLLILALIVNAVSWIFIVWKTHSLTDWRTTQYNVYGSSSFGPPQFLFEIPGLGSLIIVINVVIAYFLHKRNALYARILVGTTAFLQVLAIIPLFAIYYIGNLTA